MAVVECRGGVGDYSDFSFLDDVDVDIDFKIEIKDSTTAYNKNIAIEIESEETDIKELNIIARKDLDELSKA